MLQLKNQTSERKIEWLFNYFNVERNYCVLKSRNLLSSLNKIIKFDKNEKDSKMENPTHGFRDTNPILQLIWESQIKSETMVSWSSQTKKEGIFCTVYFVRRKFFCILDVYWIKYTFRIHILVHIKKHYFIRFFCLLSKSSKAFSVSLRREGREMPNSYKLYD